MQFSCPSSSFSSISYFQYKTIGHFYRESSMTLYVNKSTLSFEHFFKDLRQFSKPSFHQFVSLCTLTFFLMFVLYHIHHQNKKKGSNKFKDTHNFYFYCNSPLIRTKIIQTVNIYLFSFTNNKPTLRRHRITFTIL